MSEKLRVRDWAAERDSILRRLRENDQTLTVLDVGIGQWHGCEAHIGDQGAKDLADALRVNQTLTKLHVWLNRIGDLLEEELEHLMSEEERELRWAQISKGADRLYITLRCCHKRPECLLSCLNIHIIQSIWQQCNSDKLFLRRLGGKLD